MDTSGVVGLESTLIARSNVHYASMPSSISAQPRLSSVRDPLPLKAVRDAVLRRIKSEGRYPWRTASEATRQSLADNAFSRFRALLGVKLISCRLDAQRVEAEVKCRVLNLMAALVMPKSECIPVV